jgi:hypothetical protein
MTSEPLPEYFVQHLKYEGHKGNDFEVVFFAIFSRVCALRAQHKSAGFVSDAMVEEANTIIQLFDDWDPEFPTWVMPEGHRSFKKNSTAPGVNASNADKAHRFIWVAMSWLLILIARLLTYEILIVYHRAQQAIMPSPETESALQAATTAQIDHIEDTKDAVEYYFETLLDSRATTRSIGAHMLMLPLAVLLGLSTTGPETLVWSAKTAGTLADIFSIKQGKQVADFLMKGLRQQTFALSLAEGSTSQSSAVDVVDVAGEGVEELEMPVGGGLPTPDASPAKMGPAVPEILIS